MATVFSTATLGLSVDNKEFDKQLTLSARLTEAKLRNMQSQVDAFDERWKQMTGGIKNTRKIISGILISQGFYALLNAITSGTSAALEFSSAMEQAGVSLEYFVDAAAGTELAAQKVTAYLREVNEFAARTPFSTSDVLSLSTYMQSVGVAINQTQSVLSVLTDAAAATGATSENLQRITFALGQIMTKGRLANEEIRQLANANIPIYEILQEELGLTGAQISNIGKYWVDAGDSVVAILRGLEKRYDGAADRIADTFAGMTDTIIDDSKIIANELFSGLYDSLKSKTGTLRDTLDEWREIVNEYGAAGLVDTWLTDIDPTGQFANEVFHIIGHLVNLRDALHQLWTESAELRRLFSGTLGESTRIAIGSITGLIRALDALLALLNKSGVSSSMLAEAIAKLIVAYKASQWFATLGQGMVSVANKASEAAISLTSLLPASLSAQSGIVSLTASVSGLIGTLALLMSMLSAFKSSFSGLKGDTTSGIASSWRAAVDEYAKQRAAWNEQIKKYQQSYRESYEQLGTGKTSAITSDDDDKKKSGAGGSSQSSKEWVAAFDEVYDVPDEDEITGGSTIADVVDALADLGDFPFPDLSDIKLETPKLDLDMFGDDLLKGDVGELDWKSFLPPLITTAALSIGRILANEALKNHKAINDAAATISSKRYVSPDIDAKAAETLRKEYELNTERITHSMEQVRQAVDKATKFNDLDDTKAAKLLIDNTNKLLEVATEQADVLDTINALNNRPLADRAVLESARRELLGNAGDIFKQRWRQLVDRRQMLPGGQEYLEVVDEIKVLEKQALKQFGIPIRLLGEGVDDLAKTVEADIENVVKILRREDFGKLREGGRLFTNVDNVQDLIDAMRRVDESLDAYRKQFGSYSSDAVVLYNYIRTKLGDTYGMLNKYVKNADRIADAYTVQQLQNILSGRSGLTQEDKLAVDLDRLQITMRDLHNQIEEGTVADIRAALLQRQAEAKRAEEARAMAAAQQRAEAAAEYEARVADAYNQRMQRIEADAIRSRNERYNTFDDLLKKVEAEPKDVADALKPYLGTGISREDLADLYSAQQADGIRKELNEAHAAVLATEQQLADIDARLGVLRAAPESVADSLDTVVAEVRNIAMAIDETEDAAEIALLREKLFTQLRLGQNTLVDAITEGFTNAGTTDTISNIIAAINTDKLQGMLGKADKNVLLEQFERGGLFDEAVRQLRAAGDAFKTQGPAEGLAELLVQRIDVTDQLEAATGIFKNLDKRVKHVDQLVAQYGRTSSIGEMLDKGIFRYTFDVGEDLARQSDVLTALIDGAVPSYVKLTQQTEEALASYAESLPLVLKQMLDTSNMSVNDLLLTGTKSVFSTTGMDAFGKSIAQYIADALSNTEVYSRYATPDASKFVQNAADLGAVFEDYVRTAVATRFKSLGIETFRAGEAMQPGLDLLVQYDSLIRGKGLEQALGEAADYAFNDIKIFGQDVVDAFQRLSKPAGTVMMNGLPIDDNTYRTINAELLRTIGREGLASQMLAQRTVAGSRYNFISMMSRDTDLLDLLPADKQQSFLDTFRRLITDASAATGHGQLTNADFEKIGGRIFSTDALEAFRKAVGDSAATAADYRRAVVDQLFASREAGFSFEDLNKAIQVFRVDFEDARSISDAARIVDASAEDLSKVFLLLSGNGEDAAKYLTSFVKLVDQSSGMASMLTPSTRSIPLPTSSLSRWIQSIIPDAEFNARAFGAKDFTPDISQRIADLMQSYRKAIADNIDIDSAGEALRRGLTQIIDDLDNALGGLDVSDLYSTYGRAVRDTRHYYDDISTMVEALARMRETPEMLMEVPALITSTQSQMVKLAQQIATGQEVTIGQVRSLSRRYAQMVDTLGIYGDAAALKTGDIIQDMLRQLEGAVDKKAVLSTDLLKDLTMPVRFAGTGEAIPYVLDSIKKGVSNGSLSFTAEQAEEISKLVAKYGTDVADDWTTYLAKNFKPAGRFLLGLDLETTGLPFYDAKGIEHLPDVMQAAVANLSGARGDMVSSMINAGSHQRNLQNLETMMNLSGDAEDGLSDVAHAWRNWVNSIGGLEQAALELDEAPTLEEFWKLVRNRYGAGNVVTGYNAVGAAGFDMNLLRRLGAIDDNLFAGGYDIMSQARDIFRRQTGKAPTFKLSELYEMLTGTSGSAAHMADYDIDEMTRTVYNAINDGTLEALAKFASEQGVGARNVGTTLTEAAVAWRGETGGVTEAVDTAAFYGEEAQRARMFERDVERITAAAVEEAERTVDATVEAVENGTKDAGAAVDELVSKKGIFSRIKEYFTGFKNLDTDFDSAYEALKNIQVALDAAGGVDAELEASLKLAQTRLRAASIAEAAKRIKTTGERFTGSFSEFLKAVGKSTDQAEYIALSAAKGADDISGFGKSLTMSGKELLEAAFDGLDRARKAQQPLEDAFRILKGLGAEGENTAQALESAGYLIYNSAFGSSKDVLKAYRRLETAFNAGQDVNKYVDSLANTIRQTAISFGFNLTDTTDDLIKNFVSGSGLYEQQLKAIAQHLDSSIGDTVFAARRAAEAGESTAYAGKVAAEAIKTTSDDFAGALRRFKTGLDKATYGTLGVLDVVFAVVSAGLQGLQNYAETTASGQRAVIAAHNLGQGDLADRVMAADNNYRNGIFDRSVLGATIYKGVKEAVVESLATSGLASLGAMGAGALASAALPALGLTGPIGLIAGAAATLTGIATSTVLGMTGYRENSNVHYDEWLKAIRSGEFVDIDALTAALAEQYGARNEQLISEWTAQWNEIVKEQTMREMLGVGGLNRENIWERDKVASVLSGASYGNDNDRIRIAAALGLIDLNDVTTGARTGDRLNYNALAVREGADGEAIARVLSNVLGKELHVDGNVIVDASGAAIEADFANIDALTASVEAVKGGLSVGDIPTSIMETISESSGLLREYANQVGAYNAAAQLNISDTLAAYNELFGTRFSEQDLTDTAGLGDAVIKFIGERLEAYINERNLGAELRGQYAYNSLADRLRSFTANDGQGVDLTSGEKLERFGDNARSVASVLTGYDLSKLPDAITALNAIGFRIDEAGTKNGVDYTVISNDVDLMSEAIRGFVFDTKKWADELGNQDIVMDSLSISAADASILADAGIQIYGDGTVAISYARENAAELTGAERESTKSFSEFTTPTEIRRGAEGDYSLVGGEGTGRIAELSAADLSALSNAGLTLNVEKQVAELTLDIKKIQKQLKGAAFAISDTVKNSVQPAAQKALKNLGITIEDGFTWISNSSILSGQQTLVDVLKSAGIWDTLKTSTQDAFNNISKLIATGDEQINNALQQTGENVVENITTYAAKIRIPSPLKADELTDEIRSDFKHLQVDFSEAQGNFYMEISRTGEFFTQKLSLIPVDTWTRLQEDVLNHLGEIGIEARRLGTQMCVDLSNVSAEGANAIIAAFVDKPDEWALIPETMRSKLAETAEISEEEMLVISNVLDTSSKAINDNWALAWSALGPEADKDLANASGVVKSGFATITRIVDEAHVDTLLANEVAVPFEALPKSVQDSLTGGDDSLRQSLVGSKAVLQDVTSQAFSGMTAETAAMLGTMSSAADSIEATVQRMIDAWLRMQAIQSNLGKNERITSITESGGTLTVTTKTDDRFGGRIKGQESTLTVDENGKVIRRATGGLTSGLTLTGERGRELAIFPDGTVQVLGEDGPELGDMPAGTRILNNKDTEDVLRYKGAFSHLDAYADGNTDLVVNEEDDTVSVQPDMTLREAAELVATAIHDAADVIGDRVDINSFGSIIKVAADSVTGAMGSTVSSSYSDISSSISNIESQLAALQSVQREGAEFITDSVNAVDEHTVQYYEELIASYKNSNQQLEGSLSESIRAVADVDSISDEMLVRIADEIAAAREDWHAATSEEERIAAHQRAEDARNLLGYSGGENGTEVNVLDRDQLSEASIKQIELLASIVEAFNGNSDALLEYLDGVKEELMLQSSDESTKAIDAIDAFRSQLVDAESTALTNDIESGAATRSTIMDGCGQVAAAVGAYVQYAESTMAAQAAEIEFLSRALNSLSDSSDKATVSAHAAGGLVTGDTLARVGEFGKDEAIIPLEQPSVMAKIGHAVAGAMDIDSLSGVSRSMPEFETITDSISRGTETIVTALHDAMLTLGEELASRYTDVMSDQLQHSDEYITRLIESTDSGMTTLNSSIGGIETSISSTLQNLNTTIGSYNDNLTTTVATLTEMLDSQQAVMVEVLNLVQQIGQQQIDNSGSTLTETQSMLAQLDSVDTTLVTEVAAGIARAKEDYLQAYEAGETAAMEQAHLDAEAWRAQLGYCTDSTGLLISTLNDENMTAEQENQTLLVAGLTETLAGNHDALHEQINELYEKLNLDSSTNTEVIRAALAAFETDAYLKLDTMQMVSSAEAVDIQSTIIAGCNEVAAAVGAYVRYAESTMEAQRREIAFLEAALASAMSDGAATGGIVSTDKLYHLAEGGRDEAVLPLRNPSIMNEVGSTIASFMPDNVSELSGALGVMQSVRPTVATQQVDTEGIVSRVTQSVLESVLPAMSYNPGGEERTPVYVGTLIADERGLKQLERKLYDIRKAEEVRRN